MSQLAVFNSLKSTLEAISGVKHVALWNNQVSNENIEIPFLYPAIFIQFTNDNFQELSKGNQLYDSVVTLHICFESYATDDTAILTLKETVYSAVHKKTQTNTNSPMYRIAERENYDHNNIQVYEQDYRTTIKDFGADQRATTSATVTILATPKTIL